MSFSIFRNVTLCAEDVISIEHLRNGVSTKLEKNEGEALRMVLGVGVWQEAGNY